ncbi:hypothetical protein AAFF_G00049150 [Aldrovandia affinis]|uniref:Uncharacterized protein n=1 Tax=Aldrovandia affinis TaxID=143900 RepID=A0AAD7WEY5_9TELE|nr:hypothetical protein AAFF_G00049150 [Aldrovandia affinis]
MSPSCQLSRRPVGERPEVQRLPIVRWGDEEEEEEEREEGGTPKTPLGEERSTTPHFTSRCIRQAALGSGSSQYRVVVREKGKQRQVSQLAL